MREIRDVLRLRAQRGCGRRRIVRNPDLGRSRFRVPRGEARHVRAVIQAGLETELQRRLARKHSRRCLRLVTALDWKRWPLSFESCGQLRRNGLPNLQTPRPLKAQRAARLPGSRGPIRRNGTQSDYVVSRDRFVSIPVPDALPEPEHRSPEAP